MKLTTTTVSKRELLPAGKTEAIHFDDEIPGFGLRIREGGSRSFVFQYKLGSKQRRMALGVATPETIAEARKTAAKLHARVKLGQDPASDKVEAQRQASETFGPSAEEFLDTLRERYRPGSFREIRRHLLLHAKPLHALAGRADHAPRCRRLNCSGHQAERRSDEQIECAAHYRCCSHG